MIAQPEAAFGVLGPGLDPPHTAVVHVHPGGAAAGAAGAHARHPRQPPRRRGLAFPGVAQGACRAQVEKVARHGPCGFLTGTGGDAGARPAAFDGQHRLPGDLLAEADTAGAQDASAAVEDEPRSEDETLRRLRRLGRRSAAPGNPHRLLQLALARPLADGAVRRMAQQQVVEHALPGPPPLRAHRGRPTSPRRPCDCRW